MVWNNSRGTTTAVATEVFLYPGGTDHNVTWSIPSGVNMILENVTALPPMLTNNRITHLSLKYAVVSGVTNCFASFSFANASLNTGLVTKTSSYNVGATDSTVLLNGVGLTATLPSAAGIKGQQYTIKLIATSTATVATSNNQTIDGTTTYPLTAQYKYVTVQSDGSQWWVIANN